MPASARPRRRRIAVVAGLAALALVVYAGVVALYALNQVSRLSGDCAPTEGALVVDVTPQSVDAVRDRIGVAVSIREEGPIAVTDLGYESPVSIVVNGADGERTFTTAANTIPATFSVTLFADGEVEQWPFDAHTATAQIVVIETPTDGTRPSAYAPEVCVQGQVSGWTLTAEERPGSDELVIGTDPVPAAAITAHRSSAVVAFGVVLLALLVTLPVLGLTVAIAAYRGRRKVEATLMSWMAAMLFATVPLRTFLPGSPPVGSWVDYLVVLWVVVGLVAALVVYVLAWLKWTPAAGPLPER